MRIGALVLGGLGGSCHPRPSTTLEAAGSRPMSEPREPNEADPRQGPEAPAPLASSPAPSPPTASPPDGVPLEPPPAFESTPPEDDQPREVEVELKPDSDPSGAAAVPCCKTCRKGKACGDTCIARHEDCDEGPGCACDGMPEGG